MTTAKQVDLSKWQLAELATTTRGQKFCQLTSDNKPVTFRLGSKLQTRIGASTFDKTVDASRKNLDFDVTDHPAIRDCLSKVDQWAVEYISKHSVRLFKKQMTKEAVLEHYRPVLHMYGDTASVRTKINTRGPRRADCWDPDNNTRDLPEDCWLDNQYDAHVALPQMYVMGNDFGWTLETTALRVHPVEVQCPF